MTTSTIPLVNLAHFSPGMHGGGAFVLLLLALGIVLVVALAVSFRDR